MSSPPGRTRAQARAWVRDAVTRPGRRILGLTGPPGAGKSTLAAALCADAQDQRAGSAVIVGMDAWHLAHSVLVERGLAERKGAPDTFDPAGYADTLARIARQRDEPIWVPEFRREIEDAVAGAVEVLPEHRLVITEGNYLLLPGAGWRRAHAQLDACWYVDVDQQVRLRRLADRHRAYGRAPTEAEHRARVIDEANAVLVATYRSRADAVVAAG